VPNRVFIIDCTLTNMPHRLVNTSRTAGILKIVLGVVALTALMPVRMSCFVHAANENRPLDTLAVPIGLRPRVELRGRRNVSAGVFRLLNRASATTSDSMTVTSTPTDSRVRNVYPHTALGRSWLQTLEIRLSSTPTLPLSSACCG
jgi:hypothetical protein